jgi:serine/threonine protein phosphatase PrpC
MKMDFMQDMFIVVASDGVWDTMDNHDVCNYVEYFRTKCLREHRKIPKGEPISHKNSNIAQMICEESRTRWLSIVEEEDVLVDDISCIIIELNPGDSRAILNQKKAKIMKFNSQSDSQAYVRAPSIKEVNVKDPRRGTVVDPLIG